MSPFQFNLMAKFSIVDGICVASMLANGNFMTEILMTMHFLLNFQLITNAHCFLLIEPIDFLLDVCCFLKMAYLERFAGACFYLSEICMHRFVCLLPERYCLPFDKYFLRGIAQCVVEQLFYTQTISHI